MTTTTTTTTIFGHCTKQPALDSTLS